MVATNVECIIVFLSLVLTLPVLFVDNAFANAPATPTGLTVTAISETQVDLDWASTSIVNNGHTSRILRCTGVACTPILPQIATTSTGISAFSDFTVVGLTTYGYRIQEVHTGSPSNSAIVYVTTPDNTDPIITPNPITDPFELTNVDAYTEGCTSTDNDPAYVDSCAVDSGSIDTSILGLQSVTYTATDASLNTATSTVTTTIQDTTAPVLTKDQSDLVDVIINHPIPVLTVTVSDNDNTVDGDTVVCNTSLVDNSILGTYFATCDFTDPRGNPATQETYTVNIVTGDIPVITLLGVTLVDAEAGVPYVDAGATAFDIEDSDLTGSIVTVDPVDTSILGTYFVTYDVTDSDGNPAVQVVRTVNVVDTTSPVLTENLAGGGGGGMDKSPPSLVTSSLSILGGLFADPFRPLSQTTDPTAPLRINNNGYFLRGYASTVVPEQVSTGENVGLTLSFLEASSVQHVALHFVDKNSDDMSDTDPMITFDNGNVIKSDPDGILGDQITFKTSKEGVRSTFNFGFSFDKPTNRHLMITVWDEKRNSINTKIFDAFSVTGEPVVQQENHLILEDIGQYIISPDGVIDIQAQNNPVQQEQVAWFYSNSIGRLDRHDMTSLHNTIDNEQARAGTIIHNFNIETKRFVADDEKKPYDTSKRAPELTWSNVGHKVRDIANTSENKDLVHKLMWKEHLRAEKILKAYLEQRNHRE